MPRDRILGRALALPDIPWLGSKAAGRTGMPARRRRHSCLRHSCRRRGDDAPPAHPVPRGRLLCDVGRGARARDVGERPRRARRDLAGRRARPAHADRGAAPRIAALRRDGAASRRRPRTGARAAGGTERSPASRPRAGALAELRPVSSRAANIRAAEERSSPPPGPGSTVRIRPRSPATCLFIDGRRGRRSPGRSPMPRPAKIVRWRPPLDLASAHGRPSHFDQGGRLAARFGTRPRPRWSRARTLVPARASAHARIGSTTKPGRGSTNGDRGVPCDAVPAVLPAGARTAGPLPAEPYRRRPAPGGSSTRSRTSGECLFRSRSGEPHRRRVRRTRIPNPSRRSACAARRSRASGSRSGSGSRQG